MKSSIVKVASVTGSVAALLRARAAAPFLAAAMLLLLVAAAPAAPLGKEDAALYAEAFAAAERGDWRRARALASRAADKLPAKVLRWMEMAERGNGFSFEEIAAFVEGNPSWPGLGTLRLRAEEAIGESTPRGAVADWLKGNPPITTDGMIALGEGLLAQGREAEGTEALRTAWITGNFSPQMETRFLRRHGERLTKADHEARLDDLLWRGNRGQAERMLRRVDPEHRPVAVARMRLRGLSPGVDAAIRQVPDAVQQSHAGFLYDRLRWRRIRDRDEDTLEILRNAPRDMVQPERWWVERSILARRFLQNGYVTDAYRTVSEHGLTPDQPVTHAEAEWLSGWIALRFLDDADVALAHFRRLYDSVSYPISRSRGAYWTGRALDALQRHDEARKWYGIAATHDATFYGQLAAVRLGDAAPHPALPPEPEPTAAERDAFDRNELVRVIRRLHQLEQAEPLRAFLAALGREGGSPGTWALAGRLALAVERPDLGVILARMASYEGIHLVEVGYPVIEISAREPEPALLLAIARQESNFDPRALSHAGARGLMQLMPGTARDMARETAAGYSLARLTDDPEYNLHLGSAYLAGLIDRYGGSYILAIAAYNAGPSNVSRWIRRYGDPRDEAVDAVDWIEMIPFRETRNYVQRVLENLQVYRQRLELPRTEQLVLDRGATRTH